MSADQIYTELIMTHNKSQHNKRELADFSVVERGHNPNCGDDLTLQVKVEEDTLVDAAYIGMGCAISQASISIMIDIVKGKKVDEVKALIRIFLKMTHGEILLPEEIELLSDAVAFSGLSKMPARIKCGTLGWHCLEEGLERLEK